MNWATELKKIREAAGISQGKMAELIGIPQKTWSNYESGRSRLKMSVILALDAKGFSIPGLTSTVCDIIESGIIDEEEARYKLNSENIKNLGLSDDADINILSKAIHKQWLEYKNSPAKQDDYKIPILRQKVSCGSGANWDTNDNIEQYLEIHTIIPQLGIGRAFAIKAQGSSMLGAGIHADDYILFDSTATQKPHDGIYVFTLDGDVYCKRLEFDKLAQKIKIFSMRVADLEKAELVTTLDTADASFVDRFRIFGRVIRAIRLIDLTDR